ncbi:hypothetical protein ACFQ51_45535 [Streptomyces kaempferi]
MEAAALDERYAVDVEALREVPPGPIGVGGIGASFGAVWISPTPATRSSLPRRSATLRCSRRT